MKIEQGRGFRVDGRRLGNTAGGDEKDKKGEENKKEMGEERTDGQQKGLHYYSQPSIAIAFWACTVFNSSLLCENGNTWFSSRVTTTM